MPLTGRHNQPSPSPPCMAPYEDAPVNEKLGDYFNTHNSIEGVKEPDATGARNDGYVRVLRMNYMLDRVCQTFHRNDKHYDDCPIIDADRKPLKELSTTCRLTEGDAFFANVREFQGEAVKKWNPYTEVLT